MKKIITTLLFAFFAISAVADFPSQPVHIYTFAPAGSGPDSVMRKLAEQLNSKWQVPVLIENRPGGNGAIAIESFLREKSDGYSLLMTDINSIVLFPKDITEGIKPLISILYSDLFVITSPQITNLKELTTALDTKPGYGSWGVASAPHLLGLEFANQLHVNGAVHVPYKDYNQWFIDTSNGELSYSFATAGSANRLVKVNRLRYLAVAANTRNAKLPDVPTVKELTGHAVDVLRPWMAFYTQVGVPLDVQLKLIADIKEAAAAEPVQSTIAVLDYTPWTITDNELTKFTKSEILLYKRLFNEYHISP